VDYRDDILTLRAACKFKLPHVTEGGADQAAAAERQKKKNNTHKTKIEILLKYQHQDCMLKE
jgi:hypothetical protein